FVRVNADSLEDNLLTDTSGIIASSVKTFVVDTSEVTYPWQSNRDKTIKEFIHPVSSQSNLGADRQSLSQLKVRDRNLSLGRYCFLTGDDGKFFHTLIY